MWYNQNRRESGRLTLRKGGNSMENEQMILAIFLAYIILDIIKTILEIIKTIKK